ncbi:MAG: hypothetical protein GTO45_20555 [Candidatus Aminicenantes bacterium]|nr:hypothetical protein [Candidatus Aminicenantes bacterium]NIM81180.1 hypothetical protein [Candidatus Aminicenantes bacterium]NIN20555.1 hypothetical protein [Candidatus Aminicenantes bacterium]NIN44334.1 hypothetical protein [Candidatus Aminicenantes bacterium]NIN87153.1 hypothetical protein [Candidatus Aminicenantes bacterium]
MTSFAFILLNLVMLFSSHLAAYRYFHKSPFSQQLITTFLIYACQVTFSILFLGLMVKNLGLPWILLLNSAISFSIIFIFRKTIKESLVQSYEKILNFSKDMFRARDFFLYLVVFLLIIQVVLLLIKIYYLPPHVWDVFAYHLHPVAEWQQQNMIPGFIDSPVTRLNRNPMGSRLLHFWCLHFSPDIRWIELPQFIFGLLVVLVSYSLMLKMNIGKIIALKYAILTYFIPLILIQSRTCQDHLVLTGATLMAALYFVNVFYEGKNNQIIFLSLSLGLLLGIKISTPHIIAVFFLALLLSRGFNRFKFLEFAGKNKTKIVLGLLIILAMGGYWFLKDQLILRSYLNTFSKLFSGKFLYILFSVVLLVLFLRIGLKKLRVKEFLKRHKVIAVMGIVVILILGSYGILKHKGLIKTFVLAYQSPTPLLHSSSLAAEYPILKTMDSQFFRNLLVFPFRIKDIGYYTSYTPDFLEKSGFGIQFFGFGLIAYIVMAIGCVVKKKYRNDIVGFITIFSIVLLLSYFVYYYSAANYRMFMFFPVIGMMLWAFMITSLDFPRYYLKYIDVLILVMILFNFSVCFFEGNMMANKWKTLFTVNNPLERTSSKYSHFLKGNDWQFIDNYVHPREPIGYTGHYDSWVFPYFDNRLERKIYYLPALPGFKLAKMTPKTNRLVFTPGFVESLKRRGIHFIHINRKGARHLSKKIKGVYIDDNRVYRVTKNLYYFKW